MERDDEAAALRHRLSRLRLALKRVDEPLAATLLQNAITDLENRLNAMQSPMHSPPADVPQASAQQQQQPQAEDGPAGAKDEGQSHEPEADRGE